MVARVSMTHSAQSGRYNVTNTNALNEMLKRVHHDKKRYVIPNLFRNLEVGNGKRFIAFVLVYSWHSLSFVLFVHEI